MLARAHGATSLFAFKNPSRKSSVTMESSFALMSSAAASRRCRAVRSSGDSSTISAGSPVTFSSSCALETNDDFEGSTVSKRDKKVPEVAKDSPILMHTAFDQKLARAFLPSRLQIV